MLKGQPLCPDGYEILGRKRTLNYDDAAANVRTELHIVSVADRTRVDLMCDVQTAFNGSTPTAQIIARDAAGNLLATIMDAAGCSLDTLTSGTTRRCVFFPPVPCDIFVSYLRPASGNTTGVAELAAQILADPVADSTLGGDVLT